MKKQGIQLLNQLKCITNRSKMLNYFRALCTPQKIKKNAQAFFFDDSSFYRLNLGCQGDAYYGYVNIDDTRTKGRIYVASMFHLPFADSQVKFVLVDFKSVQKYRNRWLCIFREWARIMVPNGFLVVDNYVSDEQTLELFVQAGFVRIFKNADCAVPVAHFVYAPFEAREYVHEWYATYTDTNIVLSSSASKGAVPVSADMLHIKEGGYSRIILDHVLEYISPCHMESFFTNLAKCLRGDGVVSISIYNEKLLCDGKIINFFDKSNLVQYIRESGFVLQKMELRNESLYAEIQKRDMVAPPAGIERERKKRVCVLGQFLLYRYHHLGLDWDGLPYAMDQLGWDYLLLESMRNIDYERLRDAIVKYQPEYLFLMLKENLPFVEYMKDDLKRMGTKTIFWYCDPDDPWAWKMDLNGVVDHMFLSNSGQLDEYKRALNLTNVHYMTQAITPYIMYHHALPEKYDVAFLGALSKASLHNTRRLAVEAMAARFNVAVRNNIRNHVSEFYAQSKFAFGCSDFDAELYTSNRFWVALGCGTTYLTNKFSGVEKLVRNHEHALWFENIDELISLIDYYLQHDDKRIAIGRNAAQLALKKHTYAHRLKNMFDIVDGKTNDFYGFID